MWLEACQDEPLTVHALVSCRNNWKSRRIERPTPWIAMQCMSKYIACLVTTYVAMP